MSMWRKARARAAPSLGPAAAGSLVFPPVLTQLELECRAMLSYALKQGLAMPPEVPARFAELQAASAPAGPSRDGIHVLPVLHRRLVRVIHPATPQAVVLIERERMRGGWLRWLGPIPLIRTLTLTSIVCLGAVVGIAMSSKVSEANMALGFLESSGGTLYWNTMFVLACAGLGAAFSALFQAHRYVANATYDPRFDSSYAARMILGLIAGLILVELLPEDLFHDSSLGAFGKPAMAMMGGFSATAVYRLLQRLVDVMETVVRGDPGEQAKSMAESQRAVVDSDRMRKHGQLAASVLELQQGLGDDVPVEQARQRLAVMARQLVSGDE